MVRPQLKLNSPADTHVEAAHIVLPSHTNHMGTMFGGVLMQWIDIAAAISASRHARGLAVTVSMDRLHFLRPIRIEDVVIVVAEVVFTGRTSMDIEVEVWAENPWTQKRNLATRAFLTFVAVDEEGKPREIPGIKAVTASDKRRQKEARIRREERQRERNGQRQRGH